MALYRPICNHPVAHREWATRKGCVLPHCGNPRCEICPGKYPYVSWFMESLWQHQRDALLYLSTPSVTEERFRRFFEQPFVKHAERSALPFEWDPGIVGGHKETENPDG